jgi:hypothetical protein
MTESKVQKGLTEINDLAKKNVRRYAAGSAEHADWSRVEQLSRTGDARKYEDDPSEKERKANAKKNPTK